MLSSVHAQVNPFGSSSACRAFLPRSGFFNSLLEPQFPSAFRFFDGSGMVPSIFVSVHVSARVVQVLMRFCDSSPSSLSTSVRAKGDSVSSMDASASSASRLMFSGISTSGSGVCGCSTFSCCGEIWRRKSAGIHLLPANTSHSTQPFAAAVRRGCSAM